MFSSASRSIHLAFFLMAMTENPTSIQPWSFPFSICSASHNLAKVNQLNIVQILQNLNTREQSCYGSSWPGQCDLLHDRSKANISFSIMKEIKTFIDNHFHQYLEDDYKALVFFVLTSDLLLPYLRVPLSRKKYLCEEGERRRVN